MPDRVLKDWTMYPSKTPENGAQFTKHIHNQTYEFIAKSDHTGRAVFITGGNAGIGKAIALSFARAGAAYIGLGSIDPFEGIEQDLHEAARQGGQSQVPRILCLKLDVTDSDSVKHTAERLSQEWPKLDVVINNAGFMTEALPVIETDEMSWWKTFEVNLKGVYLMSKYFTPLLLRSKDGLCTMVNINSVAAHNLRINASAYGTSKVAVLKFTEFLLAEQAAQGLLAYSVHPGGIMTKLAEAMPKETHGALTDDPTMTGDFITFLTQVKREWLAGTYLSCTWDMKELIAREGEIKNSDALKIRLLLP